MYDEVRMVHLLDLTSEVYFKKTKNILFENFIFANKEIRNSSKKKFFTLTSLVSKRIHGRLVRDKY